LADFSADVVVVGEGVALKYFGICSSAGIIKFQIWATPLCNVSYLAKIKVDYTSKSITHEGVTLGMNK
jgi:hypothetical protein